MALFVIAENANKMDGELLKNLLLFINQLLENQNKIVQKSIYEFMRTNKKAELIFEKFYSFIQK
jgi:hypothetical protein